MFKKLAVAALLGLLAGPALAQNVQCPERPPNDNSNACASTSYVDRAAAGAGVTSFNGRVGVVVPATNDYNFNQLAGIAALNQGGTNANLTADNGGVLWSNATQVQILAHTTTANLPLLSGNAATPAWATISYPTSATSGGIVYFNSATSMASSGVLGANTIMLGGGGGAAPTTASGCSVNPVANVSCQSSISQLPTFGMQNDANDSNSVQYNAIKTRASGAVISGDSIFNFFGAGFSNGGNRFASQFGATVAAAPSGNNVPTKFQFITSNASGLLNQTLAFDNAAHLGVTASVASTSAGTCGTSPGTPSGSDFSGQVVTGTAAPTACTINFAANYSTAPKCMCGLSAGIGCGQSASAIGSVTFTFAAGATSNTLTWHCFGN